MQPSPNRANRSKRSKVHELIPMGAGASFACKIAIVPCFEFFWHEHPELELTLIVEGRGTRHVGDAVEEFAEGDLCLIGSGTPHTWNTAPIPGRTVHSIYAQFSAAPIQAAAASLPELRRLSRLFARARRGLCLQGRVRELAEAGLREMGAERDPLGRLALLLRILALLGDGRGCRPLASVAFESVEEPVSGRGDRSLASLQRFIHDHRAESLPQRRVAEVAGVSTAAFSRFFKTNFNRTYRGYINEMRVADACRLLADSDRSVVDIALACGFANLSNFNRRFRQVKGTAPREYRKAARGE